MKQFTEEIRIITQWMKYSKASAKINSTNVLIGR